MPMMADDKVEDISPPFHGFIATTYDALLVFEAARRGMIPRVTRRLNDTERNMVQSGSVFVYDEQESGIKRWTDGHSWSPSRILGNFLVYRETIKPSDGKEGEETAPKQEYGSGRPDSSHGRPTTSHSSPGTNTSPTDPASIGNYAESSRMAMEAAARPLAHGQMRPRSAAEAGGCRLENGVIIDRHLERKLVGSLTNSYLFQPGGLVKKTMTLTINGFHQHVVSYYTLEDATAGRLRRPSTIPEFTALEISPEYLAVGNFRTTPSIEMGHDGIPRYHGEPDDRAVSPGRGGLPGPYGAEMYGDPYGPSAGAGFDPHHQPRLRSVTVPNLSSTSSPGIPSGYPMPPGSAGGYYDQSVHMSGRPTSGPMRPSTGSRRYDPYGGMRGGHGMSGDSGHSRRLSQPPSSSDGFYPQGGDYNYQPPATAPGGFTYYSSTAPPQQPPTQASGASPMVSPQYGGSAPGSYTSWHAPPAPPVRLMSRPDVLSGSGEYPASSSTSMDSGGPGAGVPPDGWTGIPGNQTGQAWDNHPPQLPQPYPVSQDGWQAGIA